LFQLKIKNYEYKAENIFAFLYDWFGKLVNIVGVGLAPVHKNIALTCRAAASAAPTEDVMISILFLDKSDACMGIFTEYDS